MLPIHRAPPKFVDQSVQGRDLRDRHQGHRPARALPPRRQDRPLRRRRRRQDRRSCMELINNVAKEHGGVSVLRRRRRAHPRGQRPLPRDGGVEARHDGEPVLSKTALVYGQMNEPPGARARVALSALTVRRVLPRRGRAGRAALHRQHLPLHPGGLGSVRAPRPHPERRRLPADAVHRDGRAAGAHHLDQQGLDHLGAGHLRARRRPHRPGAGDGVRPPRRDHRALARASPSSASTRPSIRSTRRRRSRRPASSAQEHYTVARQVQRILQKYKELAGHHRHPRHGRARRRTTS